MNARFRTLSVAVCCLLVGPVLLDAAAPTPAGAFATGRYRNLFREGGHSDQEIQKKIDAAFQQLFHGAPDTQAVFYWAGENPNGRLAYLSDINNRDVRSEGMSYGMMIAVQLDKKAEFDALWNWSRTFMYHDSPAHPAYGFFSWSLKTDGTPISESPAPDGEEYYTMALYFASARWGDGKGIYNYRAMADRLLSDMKNRGVITGPWASRPDRSETDGAEFNLEHKMVRFTPDNRRPDHTDPSYHLPAYYELWARWGPSADRPFWTEAARVSRDFLQKTTNPVTGLAPEYANFDATPVINSRNQRSSTFGPDAWRTAANWSVDWSWWEADPRERVLSDRIQAFFESKGLGTYGNRWTLDGTTELETNHSPALVATNAVASLAATNARAARFVEELWKTDIPSGQYRYYDGLWYLMGLLHCSGQYRIWTPAWATRADGPAPSGAAGAVGIFDQHGDIGPVKTPGSAAYDATAGTYTVRAAGANMWAASDEFHFVWTRLRGDFILQARVAFLGAGVDPHRKTGLMIRSSLDPGSPHVNVSRHGDGLTALQFRRTAGANTEEVRSELNGPDVLQLQRKGDTYTMSVARFGDPYATKEITGVALGDEVYVGIYVCAHNADVSETAVLRNVRLIRPVKDGFTAYRDYIGSNVELMDVETGARRIVHRVEDSIQAPNWTPDGKRLLMNRNGRMYSFDLATRTLSDIDTGTMTRNNNDHALSFDGKMLGLSGGQPSVVFTVPVAGGAPKQITPVGPSYLHGWSPDGKLLAFTGQRNGEFDVYVVPSGGGPEKQLTTAPGLDDGPEFTPDGRWIYFNSTRTGRMQVWRMRPDGSGQEQLTFDDFNNWFPHVSPDGRSIVFITYGPEIAPTDHPWYKQVYIRKMPTNGGKPTVVAYVYGGQGSMNVNSWAPDSKTIAFVSNSDANASIAPGTPQAATPVPAGWTLVFSDEFNADGAPDPGKWDYETGYIRNREAQYYTSRPENVRAESGTLVVEGRKEAYQGYAYTSASINTRGRFEFLYGRVEVRAKLPTGNGAWPAVWMLGTNRAQVGWPACGEIDIMENVGFDPLAIHASVHTAAYNHTIGTQKTAIVNVASPSEGFHVYAMEWHPDRIEVFVDGQKYFTFRNEGAGSRAWPFDTPQYLLINLAIGGSWGGQKGIDDALFPKRFLVDYVRIYQQR